MKRMLFVLLLITTTLICKSQIKILPSDNTSGKNSDSTIETVIHHLDTIPHIAYAFEIDSLGHIHGFCTHYIVHKYLEVIEENDIVTIISKKNHVWFDDMGRMLFLYKYYKLNSYGEQEEVSVDLFPPCKDNP